MIPIAWLCAFGGDVDELPARPQAGDAVARPPRRAIRHQRRRAAKQVQRFLDGYGPRAIVIGRFVGIVRAVAPFLYGSSGMTLRTFVPWSILGTGVWATAFTLVGYVFSESFEKAADTLAHGALAFAVIVAVGLLIRAYLQQRRAKARRRRGEAPAHAPPPCITTTDAGRFHGHRPTRRARSSASPPAAGSATATSPARWGSTRPRHGG